MRLDPFLEQPLLERARRVDEEHHPSLSQGDVCRCRRARRSHDPDIRRSPCGWVAWTTRQCGRYVPLDVAWTEITREVEEGPAGPHIGAFFDLDRTLVAGFSVFTFLLDGLL